MDSSLVNILIGLLIIGGSLAFGFYTKNMMISVVIIVVYLVYILLKHGYTSTKNQNNFPLPTSYYMRKVGAQCPDYWKTVGPNQCENVQNLGNGTCNKVQDFSGPEWQGLGGYKKKSEWAKDCGIVWDGISDGKYQQLEEGTTDYQLDPLSASAGALGSMFNKFGSKVENVFNSASNEVGTQ